ncbi:MAG: hypothetical protein Q8P44_08900 [Dehalococcoidia bacterium]|nr:hypothetical protein [Dehalococcoidia bacterium]
MPSHDIIDNRKEILVDHINRILGSTEAARFSSKLLTMKCHRHTFGCNCTILGDECSIVTTINVQCYDKNTDIPMFVQ